MRRAKFREVRFRGKSRKTGEWLYDSHFVGQVWGEYDLDDCRCYTTLLREISMAKDIEVYPATIGQFADMYDSNCNEVYEGDVVVIWTDALPIRLAQVIWCETTGCFLYKDASENHYISGDVEVVIIGNIHDNSNLLTT